ncbi:MAG: alginate lyase family protein [Deinococcales bacterium]|nr:alginate lyase family protein [Chitinophagaceae bacterium]
MNKTISVTIFITCLISNVVRAQVILSNTDIIKLDFKTLAIKKARLQAKDAALLTAYETLIKKADALLQYKPVSVMDKTDFPPSGNKHDYMSIAPYWWPDPAKPNGLPYIRKDGEVNPEVRNYSDKENMPKLCENIYNLSLAYYFSNNEIYAQHASKLLQVWFIDSATKMNPNLNYGQAVKGVTEGRGEGVIDTRQFIFALDGVKLLKSSKSWTLENNKALQNWFAQFLNWLNTSKIGNAEMNAKNNHGVWFDAQALAIALYVDSTQMANKIVARAAERLDKQANNDGLFPYELERTTSLHYSVFIMNAFNIIAQLSEQTSTNFYTLQTPTGKSFQKSVEAILPYAIKEKAWTHQEIKPFHVTDAYALLLRSSTRFKNDKYLDFIKYNAKDNYSKLLLNLL